MIVLGVNYKMMIMSLFFFKSIRLILFIWDVIKVLKIDDKEEEMCEVRVFQKILRIEEISSNKYYMFFLVIEFKILVFIKDDLVFVFNNKGNIMFEKEVVKFFGLCDV